MVVDACLEGSMVADACLEGSMVADASTYMSGLDLAFRILLLYVLWPEVS